jgi:hypothetical protein
VQGSQLSPSLALYFKTYRVYDIRGRDTILEAGSFPGFWAAATLFSLSIAIRRPYRHLHGH